jgi:hypothetical protein
MLLARCAWHRRYYGVEKLIGVSSWRGLHLGFTDTICRKCAARVHSDFRLPRTVGRVPADRRRWLPGIAVVALLVMMAILLLARPTEDSPTLALRAPEPARVVMPPAPQSIDRPDTIVVVPSPSASVRELPPAHPKEVGGELRHATILYRARLPRDSAQSP